MNDKFHYSVWLDWCDCSVMIANNIDFETAIEIESHQPYYYLIDNNSLLDIKTL